MAGIGTTASGEAGVGALGVLARALGRRLPAAGVETQHQPEVVRSAGCGRARGAVYGPAVAASVAPALLR